MSPRPKLSTWRLLALGLGSGFLLAVARTLVVWGMDLVSRGHELSAVLSRLSAQAPTTVLVALVAGTIAAFSIGRLGFARGLLPAAAVLFVTLSGFGWDSAYHVPDPRSGSGRAALAGLAAAALVGALALAPIAGRVRVGIRTAVVALGLAVALPAALRLASRTPSSIVVRSTVIDLTRSMDRVRVVSDRPWRPANATPAAAVLTPALGGVIGGSDLRALRLAPPVAVEVTLEEPDGPLTFVGASGIDRGIRRELRGVELPITLHFRALRNGETVFEERIVYDDHADATLRTWRDFEVALVPGDVLRLETDVELPTGTTIGPLPVGFGGCTLERRTTVERTTATPEAPNLVFIVMDTLRADRTSVHGYERPTTPRLEALAARGIAYDQAYSTSSWTWPSTASLLTGVPVEAHGLLGIEACHLDSSHETLAEVLQRRGFTTAAFAGNPLIAADKGFDQGFEFFQGTPDRFLFSEFLMPDVLDWLERHAGTRFFLYAHLVEPHVPYRPLREHLDRFTTARPVDFPPDGLTGYEQRVRGALAAGEDPLDVVPAEHLRWMNDLYDASVATADAWVGRVLDRLDALGLAEKTVVAFTSDHGEELFDHGQFGHGHALHGEQVRVPLVLAGPGIPVGVRVAAPVSNRHLAPALARLGGAEIGGLGVVPDLLSGRLAGSSTVRFSTYSGSLDGRESQRLLGLRRDERVIHVHAEVGGEPRVLGLYDARRDPRESRNLSETEPERARELMDLALEHARSGAARAPRVQGASAGTLETLRAIGYVGEEEGD